MVIKPYQGKDPRVGEDVFIAPGAVVIGDVRIGDESSVWYNTVIRGDVGKIRIGKKTNVQDLCMLHTTAGRSDLLIGNEVTIGHQVVLHGCVIEDHCMIGMGAVIMDGAVIGRGSIVAAGAVVLENTIIPPGSMVAGLPAKVRSTMEGKERFPASKTAERYRRHAEEHAKLYKKE